MSTSLKVVRIAAVRCACTMRSAILSRIRLIGTARSSSPSRHGSRAGVAAPGHAPPAGAWAPGTNAGFGEVPVTLGGGAGLGEAVGLGGASAAPAERDTGFAGRLC